jgi:hypothetical protein
MDRPALIQRVREALRQTQLSAKEPEDLVEKWAGKLKLVPRDLHDPRREHLWKKYRLAGRAHID